MKKPFVFAAVLVAALLSPILGARAKDILRLATVDNIPPYVFMEDGKITGISVDVIRELARRGGFAVEIETAPWARVLLGLETGEVDGAFSAYETEERKTFCLYTGRIHYDELRLAVRRDRRFDCHGLRSLYGKLVGKGRNVWVSKEFAEAVADGRIKLVETDDMRMINIKMLEAGRLDAVIGSPAAMLYYIRKLGYEKDIVVLPGALKERIPAYLVLSRASRLKNKEAWQRLLTRVLDAMHADGTIRDINAKYGVDGP